MAKKKSISIPVNEPLRHENHKKPLTRRDFLSQGFIAGSAMITAPSLLSIFAGASQAYAAECAAVGGGAANTSIPFITFDLAGGANIAGSNVLVGGPGGQLNFLSTDGYSKLGLPADMIPSLAGQVNTELGLAFHVDSAFLRGIQSKTSAATRANINGAVLCARSSNDTGNNPHNPMYGIAKAGGDGQLVTLIGTRSSTSGGRSKAPADMIDATIRPTKVSSADDAKGLVDAGRLAELFPAPGAGERVMQAIERVSAMKLGKINESQAIKDLVECGYIQSTQVIAGFSNPNLLDPVLDPDLTAILSANEINASSTFEKTAAVMKLVVEGNAGAGTVELGGYDYHTGNRSTGERRDFIAGQAMGAALEFAAVRGQPLMLYVLSDGSVASNGRIDNSADGRGKGVWTADNSSTAAAFFLVYSPVVRPQIASPTSNQIGNFRADGSVETTAMPGSNNVDQLAQIIVLNYMAISGKIGEFSQVLPNHGLGSATAIDKLVALQPIV